MAIAANSVWEIRTAGSATNGGGWITGATGTDWSQQDAAQYSVTDGVTAGNTTITSATANFGTDVVGNIMYVQGGTGSVTAGWYQITARASSSSITVDRSTGLTAGTGVTLIIGGAINGIGVLGQAAVSGSPSSANDGIKVWVKAGTYSIASATANIATGCFSSTSGAYKFEGYNATRGDLGTRPLIQASGISTFVLLTITGNGAMCVNINFDGAALTSSKGCVFGDKAFLYLCQFVNFTNSALNGTEGGGMVLQCSATTCTTQPVVLGGGTFVACSFYNNTITAMSLTGTCDVANCLIYDNSGASSDGINGSAVARDSVFRNNTIVGSGRHGIIVAASVDARIINNILVNNVGTGVAVGTDALGTIQINNAFFGNGTPQSGDGAYNINPITLTADPFTNTAGDVYSLNNTSGGGAACRATSIGTPPTQTNYLDLGGLQHQDVSATLSGGSRVSLPNFTSGF